MTRDEELRELRAQLQRQVGAFQFYRGTMSEHEKLTDEALTFCRRGDLEEAKLRLERCDHPKWDSVTECAHRYEEAMKEKRAREAVGS